MRNKILSLLVLLLTAATGAWATDETPLVTIESKDYTFFSLGSLTFDDKVTVTFSNTVKNYGDNVGWYATSTPSLLTVAGTNGYTITSCKFYTEYGTATTGYTVEGESPSVYLSGYQVYTDDSKSVSIGSYGVMKIEVYGTAPAADPTVEVTTNAASEGATFTEATFAMPAFDATASYELVRDMSVQMTAQVGDGEDGAEYRIRVKKDGESFVPAEMTLQQMMALFNVHDGIENQDLVFYGDGKVCDISIFAVDDQDQPTGDAIAFAALTPGRYVAIATAAQGTIYDGTTAPSNIFELYAQYDIAFTAGNDYAIDGTTASITTQEGQNEAVDVTENIDENGLLEDVKPEATVTVTAAEGYVISAFTATLPESTDNLASINTEKTAAQFAMPESNVNVGFTFLRNMAVNMDVTVGDGEDGYRIRIKKDNQTGKFVPAEMTLQQMMALYTVHDATEQKDLVFYGDGKVCDISIFAVDDQDQPTGDAIAFTALTPGRYVAIATAVDDSNYAGTTAPSNIFELYQGYEVEIAGGEFITYYKDEAIYVEDEDVQLFSITAVGENTATATQYDVIPANRAMLVKNNSAKTKTILLIPTETDPLSFTWYEGFVGTLEATTILASDATTDRYAFNGKQFVRVKNDLAVGANKAWLEIPAANNARIINISFEETTGIDEMVNGQSSMVNGTWYDLNGRKLDKMPTKKGVYILNGRKVVVK